MEQIENHMVIGDYYADRERQYDPDVVTDVECDGEHHCALCSLYGHCRDRRPIEKCALCGMDFTDEDLYAGVCMECLEEAVDPFTVREYVAERSTSVNMLWESLFEAYFSNPDDKCKIERVSDTLKDRLMFQIVREYNDDAMLEKYGKEGRFHSKEKLVAWVGEDDAAREDFASWLIEKKK